jgi:sugar lactone lactonase YvrE
MKKMNLLMALWLSSCFGLAQVISTIAGNGTLGYTGDGGQAVLAELNSPCGVALDASGNLYIPDKNNNCVRKVTSTGLINTIAGNGTSGYSGDAGQATAAELSLPAGVIVDGSGNLYIADNGNSVVRKVVLSTGIITTVAGNGIPGYSGDGGQATAAEFGSPRGLAIDATGNLFIADYSEDVVRKVITSTGVISTVAGTGSGGYNGDGGAATSANIWSPWGINFDASGNLYIAECSNNRIRKVSAGIITTIAGNGTAGFSGDGGQASSAELSTPSGVVFDSPGNFYITDERNDRIRMVNTSGVISTVVGTATAGCTGDGGAATSAELWEPTGNMVISASTGNWYFADGEDGNCHRVKMVSSKCPANAGPNETDVQGCCGWPGVQIGSPAVPTLSYSWSPSTKLSSTTAAQPTSTWTSTTCQIYTVTVTGTVCATNTSTVQVCAQAFHGSSCCRLAGIAAENQASQAFVVFPNPSNGLLTVNLSAKADYIRVTDITGRLVFETKELAAGETQVDLSQYTKGVYFISVKTGDAVEKQKLIVE